MRVLDASALLANIYGEAGGDSVLLWPVLSISAVNLSEVLQKLEQRGFSLDQAFETVRLSQIEIVPFDAQMAEHAALTKPLGLSLGDRACLATAISRKGGVLTADRAWARLPDLGIEITIIR